MAGITVQKLIPKELTDGTSVNGDHRLSSWILVRKPCLFGRLQFCDESRREVNRQGPVSQIRKGTNLG